MCIARARTHGILSEYIDLLQGRIPKSVFARHYLKVDDVKELVQKVNAVTARIESSYLAYCSSDINTVKSEPL